MSAPLYLAELTVWDAALAATKVLRYATGQGFVTAPSETPANTVYDARMKQPALIRRDMFSAGATLGRSRTSYGDLTLLNGDGGLDDLLFYGFDGRPITIRRGAPGAAYPGGFTTVLVGTMAAPDFSDGLITVRLRDRQEDANIPLQLTKYAGNNSLPNGLEGVATDLKGKPKPLCFGKVKNVPAVCVNTSKLIYQVNDGAITSLDGVYDRGLYLGFGLKWTNSIVGAAPVNGFAYGAGLWVAVLDGGALYTSPTGKGSWTSRTSSFGASNINDVIYANGIFVAVGDAGKIATSSDGITWTQQTSNFGTDEIRTIAYGAAVFVAAGANVVTNNHHVSSPDGTTWTARTNSFGSWAIWDVLYDRALFVFVGDAGKIETSTDGLGTTARSSGVSNNLLRVASNLSHYVAVGSNSGPVILTSPDAITWTARDHGFGTDNVRTVGYFMGTTFVAGENGNYAISLDGGTTWELRTQSWGSQLRYAVGVGTDLILLGGLGGNYSYSESPGGTYSSESQLLDDSLAPAAGTYKVYLTGGYFRLGALPAGLITADVTEGSIAADRTAAQVWKRALVRAGFSGSDYSATDVTALDAANSSVIGFWATEEMLLADLLDASARSVGAWWGADRLGIFRIQQFVSPNLIENGDYEADTVGTIATGSATIIRETTQQKRGRYSLKVSVANQANSGVQWTRRSGSRIPATVGLTYLLPVWVYGTGAAIGKTLRLAIAWYTSGGSLISTSQQDGFVVAAGWQRFRFSAVAPATTATALPQLLTDSLEGTFDIWIDAIQFAAPAFSFEANDLLKPLLRPQATDPAGGLPVYHVTLRHSRNWVTQPTDLAGAVTDARRGELAQEWREVNASDATVKTAHPLSPQVTLETLLTTAADAQAEVDRQLALRSPQRDRFELEVEYLNDRLSMDLGTVLELTHDRYGLDGGKFLVITGMEPNGTDRKLAFTAWG